MHNKVGNMIGGILLEIPVSLRGMKLLKFIDTQLKKEMTQVIILKFSIIFTYDIKCSRINS